MCGRTSLAIDPDVLMGRFDAAPAEGVTIRPRYNIVPRDDLLAIQNDAPEEFDLLEWGLLPHWADGPEDVPRPINARSETVAEKPMFRDAFESRRCLIPANGFYEWKGTRGSKQPYRIERPDRSPYAYAGLWETWSPEEVKHVSPAPYSRPRRTRWSNLSTTGCPSSSRRSTKRRGSPECRRTNCSRC